MAALVKRGERSTSSRSPQTPLPEEVEKCLSKINALKRKRFQALIRNLLRDPLLWLRQRHTEEEVNAAFERPESCDTNAENILRRSRLCGESLRGEGRAAELKAVLTATADTKERDVLAVLFPNLPDVVRVQIPVQDVNVGRQRVSGSDSVHKGIVSDLFACPDGGWEGYITSIIQPKGAVYKFTSVSCVCAFPVCIGSTVQFCTSASIAADGSLGATEYFPGTFPHDYVADYLQNLEAQAASECLEGILQLPGPLKAILHEPDLHTPHQSKVLALLHNISNVKDEYFSRVVIALGIHDSRFLGSLTKTLCIPQSDTQGVAARKVSVLQFLRLVSICVCVHPDIAYKLSEVFQGCSGLTDSFREEFSLEGPKLCKAVVYACSVVRGVYSLQESPAEELPAEYSNTPSLHDPLLWVTHFFGKTVANSLREHIPGSLLQENDSGVIARRKLENIIPTVSSDPQAFDKMSTKIFTKLDLPLAQSLSSNEHEQLSEKTGIVTDLYPNKEGYIVVAPGKHYPGRSQQVFKIGPATTTNSPLPIHLGDIVQFLVSSSLPDTVQKVVKIKHCCSEALEVTFASDYLSRNKEPVQLLENEAAMKGILSAPQTYRSPDVCTRLISTAHDALSDLTPSLQKKMLTLLKSSSFIRDLIEMAPEEVSKSVVVLEKYLRHFPNEVCVLGPTLESMVDLLQKQDKPLELAAFLSFLSTSLCLLPHSVEIARQPWQSVPTLLTEDECQAGAVTNKEYLPCVKDRYTSVHDYGRTYFLLLRADCYGDLASSIHQLRDATGSHKKGTDGAIVVYDATITSFSNYSSGRKIVYHFQIKTQPQFSANVPQDSPFLKAGNLLCLSIGGRFEGDIVWATINHVSRYIDIGKTEAGEVKMCEVSVELCTESNSLSDEEAMLCLKMSGNVVALESPAYFRAYQPVLDVLKQMDIEKIHFLPDLLNPGQQPQARLELIDDSTLVTDLAGLYREGADVPIEMTVGELREQLSDSDTEFCLPEFQRVAVERALSQALSLIQGPPGTGKSYIGMQLLRLFLSMRKSTGQLILDGKPALVMAYKNRALDLFIKTCISFCPLENIVRIGHLSKDNEEGLRCVLLKEKVMSALDRNRTVELQAAMEHQYKEVIRTMMTLESTAQLQGLSDCLDYLTPEWLQSLILHGQSVVAPRDVAASVRECPERCLELLQRAQMGERDRQEREEIENTLSRAWSMWVEGINWQPQDPSTVAGGSLQYDSDSEYDSREYEVDHDTLEERNNAVEAFSSSFYDDFEHGPVDVSNVWELSLDDRRRLVRNAARKRYESAMEDFKDSIKKYNMIREIYEKRYEEKALEILKKAKVVAMTTTGAAIHQRLLCQLEAPVVFVEEAAEILESNQLAVLTPHVKHMVLIGDQKQLRPTVAWNKLASEKHKFDVSLFERLIRNKYPHTLLLRQSRMHPSLVPLFGYHYQKRANKIQSVQKTHYLAHPKCMGKNFFWWSYSGAYETKPVNSCINTHEVEMVVSLCCWLVCNGMDPGQIAVLTPYRGQLDEIKNSLEAKANEHRSMPRTLVDIDVYTVDEYQGHECDVVILSLVRSNTNGKIGFLKTPNRLVVGTSRQKCALYIVGNQTFLENSSPVLWKGFLEQCKEIDRESIGTDIPIVVGGTQWVCQSSSELEERVMKALEVEANNADRNEANETDSESEPYTTGIQSATGTPASVRSHSATGTPTSLRLQSLVSTPASVRSQSAVSTPGATPPPRSHRSQSVDSTIPTVPFRAHLENTPTPGSPFTARTPASAPPASLHQQYWTEAASASPFTNPQLPGSAVRQQSSPPTLPSAHSATRQVENPVPSDVEELVSSSTSTWDFIKCILYLKGTSAASRWKFLGRQLRVAEVEIDAIDKNPSSDLQEKFYQMMLKWKSLQGEIATKEKLIKALREESLNEIAEKLSR